MIFKDQQIGDPVLIVAAGDNRVAIEKVERTLNLMLGKADGKFVKKRTGFAIGGVPPVAHSEKVLTILDNDLKQHEQIFAAAGTPNAVFALRPDDLDRLTQGHWIDLKQ